MCGRTACTLAPGEICKACSYPSKSNLGKAKFQEPSWKDHPGTYTYRPSTNVTPTMFTPVLIKNKQLDLYEDEKLEQKSKYIIQPMMWGMIPPFYKGDSPRGHGFKTNNCRIEDIDQKKICKPSLKNGQRCVVLCDGFYEWQTTKDVKSKQPYFIHAPQDDVEIWNKEKWLKEDIWSEEEGWKGAKLLKMAGLYSQWKSPDGETVYSYTVLTMESGKEFSWIHHRIPAILETFEEVEKWLEDDDYKVAISRLVNNVRLSSYPVSALVNNSRNCDENLYYPITLNEKKVPDTPSSKFMSAWLSSSKSEKRKLDPEDRVVKKEKVKEVKKEGKKSEGLLKWFKKE